MRLKQTIVALVIAGCLATAPPAAASKVYEQQGKAGSVEYAETLPASGGNVSPPAFGGGDRTGAELAKLGAGRVGAQRLSKLGPAGGSAAAFARATAPAVTPATPSSGPATPSSGPATRSSGPATRSSGVSGQTGGTAGQTGGPAQTGGSALSGVLHLLGGSDVDGIGALLPLLLAFGLGAAVAIGVLRRRQPRA